MTLRISASLLALGVLVSGCASMATSGTGEQWHSLFDGRTLAGWHGYRETGAPANWRVVDGTIMAVAPGADLATNDKYTNFELELDWKVWPGGNSGVIYRVDESADASYLTGPEMQILDDARHADGKSPLTSAGSNFGLYPAPRGIVKPAGEWNSARVLVNGNHVEHWLNGTRMVEYELGSDDWNARVQASKFRAWKGFGHTPTGVIALQDHGDSVAFRNIRIRTLP